MEEVTAQFENHVCRPLLSDTSQSLFLRPQNGPEDRIPAREAQVQAKVQLGVIQASSIVNLFWSGRRISYGLFVLLVIGSFR